MDCATAALLVGLFANLPITSTHHLNAYGLYDRDLWVKESQPIIEEAFSVNVRCSWKGVSVSWNGTNWNDNHSGWDWLTRAYLSVQAGGDK